MALCATMAWLWARGREWGSRGNSTLTCFWMSQFSVCSARAHNLASFGTGLDEDSGASGAAEADPPLKNCLRRCLRRQSARTRTEHDEQAENLSEIDEANFPPAVPTNSPNNKADKGPYPNTNRGSNGSKLEDAVPRRTSTPSRRATERVQLYKEIHVNVKMRRPE